MTKYLYCPIEVGTRELLSRCLTACAAAEKDFVVLIGFQYTLIEHATVLPKGIYFSKGTNAISVENMTMARDNGHVVAMCEEENFFRGLKNNPIVIGSQNLDAVCDLYLAIGEDEKDYIIGRFGGRIPIQCTGNARADLLRTAFMPLYHREAESLRAEHGHHILINTNFGILNNAAPTNTPQKIFEQWDNMGVFNPSLSQSEKERIFEDYKDFERANMAALFELLLRFAGKGYRVAVRPHPAEDVETWVDRINAVGSDAIRVVTHGSHIPAILAADLIVHTACTTGVEALLLGVPALCISATDNQAVTYHLARKFNDTAGSVEAAIAAVDDHMSGKQAIMSNRNSYLDGLRHYLSAMEPSPLASDEIVSALDDLAAQRQEQLSSPSDNSRALQVLQESIHYTEMPYHQQKLGLKPGLIEDTVATLRTCLNRFHDVHCQQMSETVFKISR